MKIKTYIKIFAVMILLITPAITSCALFENKTEEPEEVEIDPTIPEPQETQESTEIEVSEGSEGSF